MNISRSVKNLIFLLTYIFSGLTLVIIIDGLLTGTELIPFNTAIERAIVLMRTPPLTNVMIAITSLGSPFTLVALSLLASVLLFVQKSKENAILFIASMLVALVSFVVLKEIFQVSRPATEALHLSGWSFPSGHTTMATTFFFMLAYSFFRYARGTLGKSILVIGSFLGAGLVAFSRLYLGAHWALDILAGIALGLVSVSFVLLASNFFTFEKPWSRGERV